jgi:biopolymer transport protein ExbB/TolQ
MSDRRPSKRKVISSENDIERRCGLSGAKYTGTMPPFTLGIGIVLTVLFYLSLSPFSDYYIAKMFYERGPVPYAIAFLMCWSFAILAVKLSKIRLQRRALDQKIVPEDPNFVLSPITAEEVIGQLYEVSDNPKHFLLFNRIERALLNLRNIGRVSDIDDILRSQSENDENYAMSTYTLVKGFIWAIPVLGFIGTVLGLSSAIGDFGKVLETAQQIETLKGALQKVSGGLSVAFDTTLCGLVAAVLLQLMVMSIRQKEEMFLDDCNEYCHRHIISRLRTLLVEDDAQVEGAP